jgi:broad-specificity NMP kinase
VTGTPGAGKSTFAKEAILRCFRIPIMVELNDIVDEYKLYSKIDEMGSKVVKFGAA